MRTVTTYHARDGKVFDIERDCVKHEAALDGLTHDCPKCKTLGWVWGRQIMGRERDLEAEGYLGQFASPQYREVVVGREKDRCDLCAGRGWTKDAKTPITETKVVGYR